MSLWKSLTATYDGTNYDKVRIDPATNSLQTVDYPHHEIHNGSHYFVTSYQDLAINNVLQFTFQTPNTTAWVNWVWVLSAESETLWQVYEGGTINNPLANAVVIRNNNRNSINTSDVTARYELHANLAAANTDVTVAAGNIIESGIIGSGRDAGSTGRDSEIVMKQNQLYVMRATATAAGYVNFNMQWYEHQNKH